MSSVLGAFGASVTFAGACAFSAALPVEQRRAAADPPTSFDVALLFDRTLWDAITARARWAGGRVQFDGADLILDRGIEVSFEETLDANRPLTMRMKVLGDLWAVPAKDPIPLAPTTCPYPPAAVVLRKSPRSFGNKPTRLYLALGASPLGMREKKLFQGMTLQRSNRGDIQVLGEFVSIDDSILYVDKAVCYQLQPFAGLHRGEIVREVAKTVGLTDAQILVPLGAEFTKPILLSNGSLLQFVNELVEPENWFASFDEEGRLLVRPIELKLPPEDPDFTLDASLGDFDLDSLEETPPSKPPQRIFVSSSTPVKNTGPGGTPLVVTTRTVEETQELYNPLCVKVRPSGGPSNLQADGQYRALAAQELIVVSRKITEITTTNGQETERVVRRFGFYNPAAYDPNFDTSPPGNSYNSAYGDKTFHLEEVERLIETSEEMTESFLDGFGTILRQVVTKKGWYAPFRALVFNGSSRTAILNQPPSAFVFAGGSERTVSVEQYIVKENVEKVFSYGPAGTLERIDEVTTDWTAPQSRCDIVQTTIDDVPIPSIPSDPYPEPPPVTKPSDPEWKPTISGPVRRVGPKFYFLASVKGHPAVNGSASSPEGFLVGPKIGFNVQFSQKIDQSDGSTAYKHGFGGLPSGGWSFGNGFGETSEISWQLFQETKPAGFLNAFVQITVTIASRQYMSKRLYFDPWAELPPGGSL